MFAAGCKLIHFRQLRCRGWWFRALRGAFVAFLNFVNKGRAVDAIVQLRVFFERESGDAKSSQFQPGLSGTSLEDLVWTAKKRKFRAHPFGVRPMVLDKTQEEPARADHGLWLAAD